MCRFYSSCLVPGKCVPKNAVLGKMCTSSFQNEENKQFSVCLESEFCLNFFFFLFLSGFLLILLFSFISLSSNNWLKYCLLLFWMLPFVPYQKIFELTLLFQGFISQLSIPNYLILVALTYDFNFPPFISFVSDYLFSLSFCSFFDEYFFETSLRSRQ